jgi:hypothetical protein
MSNCFYCGQLGDGTDHAVPIAYTTRNGRGTRRQGDLDNGHLRVPCCRECNSLLGSKLFDSIQARAAYLARKLKNRYRLLLSAPQWTDQEIAEVGPSLRAMILAKADQAAITRRRIAICQKIAAQ